MSARDYFPQAVCDSCLGVGCVEVPDATSRTGSTFSQICPRCGGIGTVTKSWDEPRAESKHCSKRRGCIYHERHDGDCYVKEEGEKR